MANIVGIDNKYYGLNQYNPTNQSVKAQTDDVLLYPIIENSADYQVAISKARIDLSGIPLTTHNIPLKTYQVGLKNGTDEYTAYVRQLGANNKNYLYNVSTGGTFSKYIYLTGGTATQVPIPEPIPINTYLQTVYQFVETDYQNVFVVGSADANASNYEILVAFDSAANVIYQQTYTSIQAMCLDRQGNLYLAIEDGGSTSIFIYKISETISPIELTLIQTLTVDANGDPLQQIQTMCAEAELIVGSEANKLTIYDTISWNAVTTYNEPEITQLGNNSAILSGYDRFCVQDIGSIPDLIYAMPWEPTGTNNILNNALDDSSFQLGPWDAGKVPIVNTGYGFGLVDGETYVFNYNPATGECDTSSLVNSDSCTSIFPFSQQNQSIYVTKSPNKLCVFNGDQTASQQYSTVQTDFGIDGTVPACCDSQLSTAKLIGLTSAGSLYITNNPVMISSMTTLYNNPEDTSLILVAQSNGFRGGNTTPLTDTSKFIKQTTTTPLGVGPTPVNICYDDSSQKYLVLYSIEGGGDLFLQIYNNDWTINGAPLNVSVIYDQYETLHDMCAFGDGNHVILTNSQSRVYIFNYNTNTITATITVPDVTFRILVCALGNFLSVCYENIVLLYDCSTLASPVLKSRNIVTSTATRITGCKLYLEPEVLDYYVYFTMNDSTLHSVNVGKITPPFGSFTPELLYTSTTTPITNRGINSIDINTNIHGIQVMMRMGESFAGTIWGWNQTANSVLFQIQAVGGTNTNLVANVALPKLLNGTYSWSPIDYSGATNLTSIAVSQTNPNLIYCTNGSGVVYSGNLVGGTIAFSSFGAVTNAFGFLNTIPMFTQSYDTYVRNYTISTQTASGNFHYDTTNVNGIARNAISGEFLVSAGGTLKSYAPETFSANWTNSTVDGLNLIYAKNGDDINAGDASIYDFTVLIDAINLAFTEAFGKAPSGAFTEAPFITLNYQSGLATLNYSSDYSAVPATKSILMNSNLHQLLYYYSVVDNTNPNFFRVVLPAASTSLTQNNKSLYLFNELDKILFISNTIFVFGSYEGANNTNNIITDIDVPTNSDGYMNNIGQVLNYQPSFLRPYTLASTTPISRVQVQIWYSTLQGEQFPLYLVPSGNWNAKLLFSRRF